MTYVSRRVCQSRDIQLRGLRFHIYEWSGNSTPLVLVHGWGDSGATFQFLVDHLAPHRTCIALDMRGFGRSEWPQEGYWFPDYLADLDALIEAMAPDTPIDLVAHSMGGNVATLYAGIRPERVRRLVNLESFGLARTQPSDAPARYRQWLDQVRDGANPYSEHESFESLEWLLRKRNPRTPADRIAFIARAWGEEVAPGHIRLRADPRHKWINPVLYRREEAESCWRAIQAPVLFVTGGRSELVQRFAAELDEANVSSLFAQVQIESIAQAGHMLHHEVPEQLAAMIESFLQRD